MVERLTKWWNTMLTGLLAGAQGLGVYLDPPGLTLLHLQKGLSQTQVLHWGQISLAEGPPETQVQRLQELTSPWGLNNCPVGLAVTRSLGFFRPVSLPRAAKDNLSQVLSYELDRFLPLGADRLFFDFQVFKTTETEIHLMLMALPQEPVGACLKLLEQAGLKPTSLELAPAAAANAFARLGRRLPSGWLLLRPGAGGFELSHIEGKALRSCRLVPVKKREEIIPLLLAEIERLREEGAAPGALCVSGQKELGLAKDSLMRKAGLAVVTRADLGVQGLPPEAQAQDAILPALGAALKGLDTVPLKANLLPAASRQKFGITGFLLTKWLFASVASLLILWIGSVFVQKRVAIYRLDQQLAQLAPEVTEVEKQLTESRTLAGQLKEIRGRVEQAPSKLVLLRELSRLIPEHTWLFNLRVDQRQVEMSGVSRSATGLIPILEKSGWFTKTEFASPINTDASGNEHFKIKAEVKRPGSRS